MRLSMWTLCDRLGQFEPEPSIGQNEQLLRNARLLSDVQEFSRSTLYLQQNDPNTVMCMNGNDMIVTHSDDVELVLNAILDIFDHCNEWAGELDDMIRGGCTLKELLERISWELRMELIVADATYLIYEHTDFASMTGNEVWQNALSQRSMSLDLIMRVDRDPMVRAPNAGVYYIDIPEYNGSWPVANVFVHGTHQGWLIGGREGSEFSKGDLALIDFARTKVEDWLAANSGEQPHKESTGVFSRILKGEDVSYDEARRALAVFGWRETDPMRLYAFKQSAPTGQPMLAVERFLRQLGANTLAVPIRDGMVLIVNEAIENATLSEEMTQVLMLSGYIAGASPEFKNIKELPACYDAACAALDSASYEPADGSALIVRFEDVKLPYLLKIIENNAVADVKHGALAILRDYDEQHATQLHDTLACFVRNRGSYVDTYEELFIHRSTLTYRLERIEALTGVDLDDDQTWAHLLISLLLE